jgi:hypothetical protein
VVKSPGCWIAAISISSRAASEVSAVIVMPAPDRSRRTAALAGSCRARSGCIRWEETVRVPDGHRSLAGAASPGPQSAHAPHPRVLAGEANQRPTPLRLGSSFRPGAESGAAAEVAQSALSQKSPTLASRSTPKNCHQQARLPELAGDTACHRHWIFTSSASCMHTISTATAMSTSSD